MDTTVVQVRDVPVEVAARSRRGPRRVANPLPRGCLQDLQLGVVVHGADVLDIARPAP